MERRKARETALELLFETEFKKEESAEEIFKKAEEVRDMEYDKYVEAVFFGVLENSESIDAKISARAIGWKMERMTKTSLSVLRLSVYEMMFMKDIPFTVSINEAVELTKKFDDEKAPSFVNGILNGVAEDLGLKSSTSES